MNGGHSFENEYEVDKIDGTKRERERDKGTNECLFEVNGRKEREGRGGEASIVGLI